MCPGERGRGRWGWLRRYHGSDDATRDVGGWSEGCQVIAGKTGEGKSNMSDAAGLLNQNEGKKFNYILIDGRELQRVAHA